MNHIQSRQINIFKACLLEKNQSVNLFSRKNSELRLKCLMDQALLAGRVLSPVLKRAKGPVLDVGSGGGFPGLVFSVLFPGTLFYLCERNKKKAEFLKYALNRTKTLNARVFLPAGGGF